MESISHGGQVYWYVCEDRKQSADIIVYGRAGFCHSGYLESTQFGRLLNRCTKSDFNQSQCC